MIRINVDRRGVVPLDDKRMNRALLRASRKAGSTALRDMRSEARKRVRARKRIKAGRVRDALHLQRPKARDGFEMTWALQVSGETTRVSDYPNARQTKKGVTVGINKGGKRTLLPGAFIATMSSGHKGVFKRKGKSRLPIFEPLASRPVDALLHEGEAAAVAERGRASFAATFDRVLPLELDKASAAGK